MSHFKRRSLNSTKSKKTDHAATPSPITAPSAPGRLLLVDDDRLIRGILVHDLGSKGYIVDAAHDGASVLALAGSASHDLAVVDIRLPDMSGIEVARRLRESFGIPSLFLSACDDEEIVQSAVAGGGLGYVVKPVALRQFLPAIESALARARDLRVLEQTKVRLEQALENGRDTCTAIGILMGLHGLARDAAFQKLRTEARNQRCSMETLAGRIVAAAETINTLTAR